MYKHGLISKEDFRQAQEYSEDPSPEHLIPIGKKPPKNHSPPKGVEHNLAKEDRQRRREAARSARTRR
jgi:hypothetical protein